MIWFTWRQFRAQALAVAAVLLVFLAALALTWTRVTGLAQDTGFTGCQAVGCDDTAETFLNTLADEVAGSLYYVGMGVLLVLPILLAMFWGAPLVARELETGTYRIIFSQSVSRRRWLLVKLAVGGVAAALSAGLVSLVLGRWAAPIDRAEASRMSPMNFATRGIVPIAFVVLAFVIGVTVGLVLRRTVAAMATTMLVVVALQIVAPGGLMLLLAQPVTSVTASNFDRQFVFSMNPSTNEVRLDISADIPDAWVLSRTTVTSTGAEFKGPADPTKCQPFPRGEASAECRAWLATQNLSQEFTYIPGSSFWALQWRVSGVLIGLTLGLSWFSLWWIRHRLA